MIQTRRCIAVLVIGISGVLAVLGLSGFKLEKSARELTETETVKAPTPEEKKKVKEGPPSPSYKMESFDDFMTASPIQKTSPSPAKKKKLKNRKWSGRR